MRDAILSLSMLALVATAAAAGPESGHHETADPQTASASDRGPSVARRNPPTIWNSTVNGHSQISVIEPGKLAFMSGQVAERRDGAPVPRDLAGQAQIVAANLAAELDDVKATPSDIVSLRMFVVNATTERFREAWTPLKERLGGNRPSLTAIGVQALWRPELQLEVEMVVRVP